MAKLALSYDVVNYTPATATAVEANFNRIEEHINQEVIERDGTVAMRAQLKLLGDPVAALDAAPKQYVDQVLPIGIIMMHGGSQVPPGGRWMICNGTELQTASYPDLYNIIGHNFSPDGTPGSRFNLPNLRDRFPMMQGGSTTMGETGGYRDAIVVKHHHGMKSHTHGMSNHTHPIDHDHPNSTTSSNGDHNHGIAGGTSLVRVGGSGTGASGTALGVQAHTFDGAHTHTVNVAPQNNKNSGIPNDNVTAGPNDNDTGEAGSDGNDRNLPPFLGVQFIIRVK